MCSSICLLAAVLLPDLAAVQLVSTLLVVPQQRVHETGFLVGCCSSGSVVPQERSKVVVFTTLRFFLDAYQTLQDHMKLQGGRVQHCNSSGTKRHTLKNGGTF